MELVSRNALAERLNITRKSVQVLLDTGVITETVTSGRNIYVPEEVAEQLADTPYVEPGHEPALLVKVVGAADDVDADSDRQWMGWKAGIPADDPRQMDGIREWWQVADPSRYCGNLLIPMAAGFVLGVYQVNGYKTGPGRLRSFDIEPATTERSAPFVGHRFVSQRGSMVAPT